MKRAKELLSNPWMIAAAIAVAIVLWMVSGIERGPDSGTATAARSAPREVPRVQVQLQRATPVERTVTAHGRTAPARTVELKAETDGRVVAIGADRGARVAAGAPIVRLDTRDREVRLAEARALLKQRELEFDARKRLADSQYVTETDLAGAQAALEAARANLRRAELDVEYAVISAPFDGALQERSVEIGDFVSSGDPIATFVDERKLIVKAAVAEHERAGLAAGQRGEARLATGQHIEGVIRYVAPVAQLSTRTFDVELEVPNPDGELPAGVTAELQLSAGKIDAQSLSPALLTLDDEGVLGVKIVDADDRVRFHPVTIVSSTPDAVFVTGLPEQTRVITVGQGFVRAGDAVEIVFDELGPRAAGLAGSAP